MTYSEKTNYHHGDLRAALLDATDKIINRDGLELFSLRACAREAGVSHNAPAHHFADLRGLLTAYATNAFDLLIDSMEYAKKSRSADPAEQLLATGEGYIQFALTHPGKFQVMFRNEKLDAKHMELQNSSAKAFGILEHAMTNWLELYHPIALTDEKKLKYILMAWSVCHGYATLAGERKLDFISGFNQGTNHHIDFGKLLLNTFIQSITYSNTTI